jgi:hypothetical protein
MAYSPLNKERYVLVIDGQRKGSYADLASAHLEAEKLRKAYPRVTVSIQDQESDDIRGEAEPKPNDAPWPD